MKENLKELDTQRKKITRNEALVMIDKLDALLPVEVQKLKSLIKRLQHRDIQR